MNRKLIIAIILVATVLVACGGLDQPVTSETPATGNQAPASPLDPLPGEDQMARGEVTVSSSELIIKESYPLQVDLAVEGTLPTPCHHLRADIQEPDRENIINVELYSLVDPNMACIQVIEPFEEQIPLGTYPDGTYSVYLNGEWVGEFTQ
jgi:hypothetical protein